MDVGASDVMESEVLYDCVICGQSGPSTEDRPTGLVVLLQASSGTTLPSNLLKLIAYTALICFMAVLICSTILHILRMKLQPE